MRLASAIFLLFCGFYLLTMSGHTYSADEETMLAVTRSLIERGDVAVLVEDGAPVAALRPGRNDQPYSPYGVLPSLLAIPLHRLGELIAPIGRSADYATRFIVMMLNSFVTAATCAVLARWAWQLGASTLWAAILALLYGLATFAWPYARTFFSEPLAGLLILIAAERAYTAWRYLRPTAQWIPLLVSGLAAGFLLTTRIAAGVVLPIIGAYVLWEAWRRSLDETSALQFTGSARRIRCVVNTAGALTLWIIGTIPVCCSFCGTTLLGLTHRLLPAMRVRHTRSLHRYKRVSSVYYSVPARVYFSLRRRSCWRYRAGSRSGGGVNGRLCCSYLDSSGRI